jgi:hypothetical protein
VCSDEDLTITLSLLLDPDLRLQFPDRALYAAWQRGLRLLLHLLVDPQGLHGGRWVKRLRGRGACPWLPAP